MTDPSGTTMWTPDDQAESLRAIALWGYTDRVIRVPADPVTFPGYAAALQNSRLIGPLLAAESIGDVDLPGDLRADLVERQQAALAWCIQLEVRLLEIHEWFDDAGGIEYRVIKGPAVTHLDSPDPSLRTFADVDLLIAARDIDRAVSVLTEHGATRPWAQRRPGFDRRFAKSVTMTCADGVEVDLHRSLADGVFGHRIPLDDLFDRTDSARGPGSRRMDHEDVADTFDIGGVTFRALDPTDRMLHTAYHLLLGSPEPKLMSLRDMVGYLHGGTAAGDLSDDVLGVAAVTDRARRWGGEAVLAMAIDQVAERLGPVSEDERSDRAGHRRTRPTGDRSGVLPDRWVEWRRSYVPDPTEIAMIERHRGEGSSLGRAKLDVVKELRGPWTKAVYLFALAWPSGEHLRSRGLERSATFASVRERIVRRAR